MIAAPGTTVIMARLSAGSPRDLPGRAISTFSTALTISVAVQNPGRALHDLPRHAPDSPASTPAHRPDLLDRDRSTVTRP